VALPRSTRAFREPGGRSSSRRPCSGMTRTKWSSPCVLLKWGRWRADGAGPLGGGALAAAVGRGQAKGVCRGAVLRSGHGRGGLWGAWCKEQRRVGGPGLVCGGLGSIGWTHGWVLFLGDCLRDRWLDAVVVVRGAGPSPNDRHDDDRFRHTPPPPPPPPAVRRLPTAAPAVLVGACARPRRDHVAARCAHLGMRRHLIERGSVQRVYRRMSVVHRGGSPHPLSRVQQW